MRLLVLTLSLAACAARPHPVIAATLVGDWSTADTQAVNSGMSTWAQLGFGYTIGKSPLPDCAPHDRSGECAIRIGIVREAGMHERYGVDGMTDRATRLITLDAQWSGWMLTALVAHEVGHVVLDTPEHVTRGVMMAQGALWNLEPDDYALACRTVRRGC